MSRNLSSRWLSALLLVGMLLTTFAPAAPAALANHTGTPTSVNLVGSLQSEATANACGDWDPGCAGSAFTAGGNGVYRFQSASIPTGSYEYKVALGSWAENYGSNFQQDGPNIALNLGAATAVSFYYDHKTHYIADSLRNTIYTVPGSFNSEVGCGGDWAPDCLATMMSDVDGDGVFTFVTDAIPAGSYEFKVATNLSWGNPNYGVNGGGDNVPFSVAGPATVTFSFNTANNTPAVSVVSSLPSPDNNVEWEGLRHDSRDTLYRTPGGAVTAGTQVTIRFRTFHNDVTGVTLRLYDVNNGAQRFVEMAPAATDVSCYQEEIVGKTCDFWAATVSEADPNNLWYRFIVTDGSDTDYYGDNTGALDGGLGRVTDDAVDSSYALMFYKAGFRAPSWARDAVIYQIFPDRFNNGRHSNDPKDGDVRYDDPVIKLPWGTLPEGFCRNYTDGNTNCPWRYDTTPPEWSPTREGPRGRDYYGGDLDGVINELGYLKSLGVTVIYFNPIFAAGSNHRYDTRDYYQIDPYLGSNSTFRKLVREAQKHGIRIVLDNVFNHMSSDSPLFDRYSHYSTLGACESLSSTYRGWFNFRTSNVPCGSADYVGWFGFDSIPEIDKHNPAVVDYFVTGPNSVSRYWLNQGAAGWRLDVMGDASFPSDYWETFRQVTRATKPDSLIIGELWQKDSTLLRHLRGETADSTMNYRLRDAVIGFLTPGPFDSKGFGDSGRIISASEFASRVESIREDYPDAAYYSTMNLLGSHDTERIRWTLTPGAETLADKEGNPANVADGMQRQRLAALFQFTMPGAPTVYYGDEAGVTGDDDPDDRRTMPYGPDRDEHLTSFYSALSALRRSCSAFTRGDLKMLVADDAAGVVAYGRKNRNDVAIVLVNRSTSSRTVTVPLAGYLPNGVRLAFSLTENTPGGAPIVVADGKVTVTLNGRSGIVFTNESAADLTAPGAPTALNVTDEGDGSVSLAWSAPSGSPVAYNIYRSPVSGGGWVKLNGAPVTSRSFTDSTVENGRLYYYAVTALDRAGNESKPSSEVSALPHYRIGWANLQWPPSISHTISASTRTPDIYGQVWIDGVTSLPGAAPGLRAQLGYGPQGSDPTGAGWAWVDATFNGNAGNNDEFKASLLPEVIGTFSYTYRYSTTGGRDWFYAVGGPNGAPSPLGTLTVLSSGDSTAPAIPTGLNVTTASPAGIGLSWDAVTGDPSLYGYEIGRSSSAGGPYTIIGQSSSTSFTDTDVDQGATYVYAVRAYDASFNRSDFSGEVSATAELRTVSVTFNVTVPSTTDATGRSVYIAGFIDRLDPYVPGTPNPQWNPGGVALTRVSATLWRITFTGREGTQIEYKLALGAWDYVEKDGGCGETANRQLTLSYGSNGIQNVNETVQNWRNVAPCGN